MVQRINDLPAIDIFFHGIYMIYDALSRAVGELDAQIDAAVDDQRESSLSVK